jgi:Mg-chelatase subunit ChlI
MAEAAALIDGVLEQVSLFCQESLAIVSQGKERPEALRSSQMKRLCMDAEWVYQLLLSLRKADEAAAANGGVHENGVGTNEAYSAILSMIVNRQPFGQAADLEENQAESASPEGGRRPSISIALSNIDHEEEEEETEESESEYASEDDDDEDEEDEDEEEQNDQKKEKKKQVEEEDSESDESSISITAAALLLAPLKRRWATQQKHHNKKTLQNTRRHRSFSLY